MDAKKIKLIAFDLDGTLSNHRSHLPEQNKETLRQLAKKYKLIMMGAGQASRIFEQMEHFPIDIIGNYGMQYATYNAETDSLDVQYNISVPCDRERVTEIAAYFREKFNLHEYAGESVEFHPSGCITFPILGTKAKIEDKLAYDPDWSKRLKMFDDVKAAFTEYEAYVGGSSSFDMAPKPYNKYYALDLYCKEHGYSHEEVIFVGDGYKPGGNDESVYKSDIHFICMDDYMEFPQKVAFLLEE